MVELQMSESSIKIPGEVLYLVFTEEELIGKKCSRCNQQLKKGDIVYSCDACGQNTHKDCLISITGDLDLRRLPCHPNSIKYCAKVMVE